LFKVVGTGKNWNVETTMFIAVETILFKIVLSTR
jgi:hypothetical protein